MKHEITSLNTKKMLAESLKKAMKQKTFSKITISEIVKDCNINRKTFYYHFEDIYALLKWIFEEETIHILQRFDLLVDYKDAINFILDYLEQNEYLINSVYDSIGRDEMRRILHKDFLNVVEQLFNRAEEVAGKSLEPDFKSFLIQFYTEAIVGMLISSIRDKISFPREKVILYLERIIETETGNLNRFMN